MADLHGHSHDSTTVVTDTGYDREGPATALIVLLILAFVGFLIWLFAFSGVVFHRGTSGGSSVTNNNTRIEQNQPAGNTGGGTTTSGGGGTTTQTSP